MDKTHWRNTTSTQFGFALIETIIAMAIATIAIGTLLTISSTNTQDLGVRKDSLLAHMVVHNLAVETRLSNRPSIGTQDGEYTLGEVQWRYQKITEPVELLDVTKTTIHVFKTLSDKTAKKPLSSIDVYLPTINAEQGS